MSETSTSSSKSPLNPLFHKQIKYLSSVPKLTQQHFFSNNHINPEKRAIIWSEQAELGENLVNNYSWATPDARALKIIKHFASLKKKPCKVGESRDVNDSDGCGIVEIGCGANAYWARQMYESGINVLAFDSELNQGGKIENDGDISNQNKKRKLNEKKLTKDEKVFENGFVIYKGGPEILSTGSSKFKDIDQRVLLLCCPDEDVFDIVEEEEKKSQHDNSLEGKSSNDDNGNKGVVNHDCDEDDDDNDQGEDEEDVHTSLGAACLQHFKGDTIIHVGELFGDTVSVDQAPWGRSSGPEFQQRLATEYHCILKVKLTNWLHVRDTISVWKRSHFCPIVFQGDDEDDCEEVQYRYIPPDEVLPIDIAAPSVKHLL